VSARRR